MELLIEREEEFKNLENSQLIILKERRKLLWERTESTWPNLLRRLAWTDHLSGRQELFISIMGRWVGLGK